jgi:hypothetical protein
MFDVVAIADDVQDDLEPLGTKPKFWFRTEAGDWCLFKEARPDTGEDWAEKIACELARLLGLPHVDYNLAEWRGRAGVVCQSFVPEGGHLEHGNELLAAVVPAYPRTQFYDVYPYTLDRVLDVLEQPHLQTPLHWPSTTGITNPVDVFIGYWMFDAWIANQDRHHENWGMITLPGAMKYLAPSYDHASSLGAIETDRARQDRLTTRDRRRSMAHYVQRARSAFYRSPNDPKTISTVEAFGHAARRGPHAAQVWLTRLTDIDVSHQVQPLFDNIPEARIAQHAAAFAMQMLELNRQRLLEQYKEST